MRAITIRQNSSFKTEFDASDLWHRVAAAFTTVESTKAALADLDCDQLDDIGATEELASRRATPSIDARTMTYLMSLR